MIAGKICCFVHLDNEGTEDDTAENEVVKDALENVPFSVNLAGVDLIEKLHHHKGVEDNGVVLRWRSVEGSVPATVDVKQLLSYGGFRRRLVVTKMESLLTHSKHPYLPAKSRVNMMMSWYTP